MKPERIENADAEYFEFREKMDAALICLGWPPFDPWKELSPEWKKAIKKPLDIWKRYDSYKNRKR